MTQRFDASLDERAARVVADLEAIAALTATPAGAQRLAWTPTWQRARDWFRTQVGELGLDVVLDAAGNGWVTLPGASTRSVIVGSHLDSVPERRLARRRAGHDGRPRGARGYARSAAPGDRASGRLGGRGGRAGSVAACSARPRQPESLVVDEIRDLKDRDGTSIVDALAQYGVSIDAHGGGQHPPAGTGRASLSRAAHRAGSGARIDPATCRRRAGHVRGRAPPAALHRARRRTRARRPLPCVGMRFSLPRRPRSSAATSPCDTRDPVRAWSAQWGRCASSRASSRPCLASATSRSISVRSMRLCSPPCSRMRARPRPGTRADNNVAVEWSPLWRIEPRPFDPALVELCRAAVREETGDAPELPSGPLHDAAEMVPHMPVAMMFAYSARGLSHCKEEDTPRPHLLASVRAFLRLVDKTVAHVAAG